LAKRVAISGASNCTYPEFKACLDKVLLNFLSSKDKPVLVFRLQDADNATHYANDNKLCYEIQFSGDAGVLIGEADCVFIFWNGENGITALDANTAKRMNKQLRIHKIQTPVTAAPIQITDLFADWGKVEEPIVEEIQYNLFDRKQ